MTLEQCLARIEELKVECAEENWDSYHARPILVRSCQVAHLLLRLLPSHLLPPDIYCGNDGVVTFEWLTLIPPAYVDISCSPNGNLICLRNEGIHTTIPFDGITLPDELVKFISTFYGE